MTARYVLALDQGTTSSRAILFDHQGRVHGQMNREFAQIYPHPGWVEHDATEIWQGQIDVARRLLANLGVAPGDIAAIGITNQRETTVLWDAATGQPVHHAIVWQCRRSAGICDDLRARNWTDRIQAKTGLVVDAYFSGTKIKWILDNVPGVRERADRGELRFGTIDTWLIWNLTGGKVHVTDYSNAARTMLFNIHTLQWDEELLAELTVPRSLLPEVSPSSQVYGTTELLGGEIAIAGCAGDQQAALFGQTCFAPGEAKNTYGTGCFLLMNTGTQPVKSERGLLTTIAWGLNGRVEYALEGSIFVAGAAVQWLRDELQLIGSAAETEAIAESISDNGGVYLVPAFSGLGAPYWDAYARGAIFGLTRGTGRTHLVRAALESMCYQTRDVLGAMEADAGIQLKALKVDGGAVTNNFVMQFQSDQLGVWVDRPIVQETTALGAAYLAGLAVGFWRDQADLIDRWGLQRRFTPSPSTDRPDRDYAGWQRAVERSRRWEQSDE